MRKLFTLLIALITITSFTSCSKSIETPTAVATAAEWDKTTMAASYETPADLAAHYTATYSAVDNPADWDATRFEDATEAQKDAVLAEIERCTGLSRYVTIMALSNDGTTWQDKKIYLDQHFLYQGRNNTEAALETIARKNAGNQNTNGGANIWDCSSSLLTTTIAQLGSNVGPLAGNNFYNAGSSATTITLQDVLRAANGYYNTSLNSAIEISDIVFEFEVSGDGNWLIGAVVTYEGQQYLYSNFPIDGLPDLGPLIWDPQDGAITIVGPMPGGITTVTNTGEWPEPPVTE